MSGFAGWRPAFVYTRNEITKKIKTFGRDKKYEYFCARKYVYNVSEKNLFR